MNRLIAVSTFALALVACAPPKPPEAAKPETPAIAPPPAVLAENFKDCTWGAVTGGGVTLNVYQCANVKFEGDETLPGIVRVATFDGTTYRDPVVQVFAKAPEAPLDAALDAVRKASPGSDTCVFAEAPEGYRREGQLVSVLTPTGKVKEKYDAFVSGKGGEELTSPCGPLGPSESGAVTFEVRQDAPGKVLMIAWPSDIAPWDYASLKVKP
jgi:hypothetical protein